MKAEKSITVTANPRKRKADEARSCLAQFGRILQRCLALLPGILNAAGGRLFSVISWPNIDHSIENLVPNMPRWYANIYQPIEFPYQRN
ncbi:hypothetical protein [Bradyrhizobium liaoningense]|uniref:hypothetical protein n=1 Tax=Bradyrhizobium liaoningense TaxID=43992 RepID=UPI001BA9D584|nr:hypothetical protein [Bradyrhizobium liaoningense]MBR0907395.1 hypothetical protein [Bradyrhizobium liaoningense]